MSLAIDRRPRLHVVIPPRAEHPERVHLPEVITNRRPAEADTVLALAKAADLGGFDGVLLPAGPDELEPWVLGGHLLRRTRHITVIVPFEPGTATPQYAAKFSASLQRFSAGRLGWAVSDEAASRTFVATAQSFWSDEDGLPPALSERVFPQVVVVGSPQTASLQTSGTNPITLLEQIAALAEQHVADVLLDVAGDPGEVYRVAERVLTALASARPSNLIGAAHVG